jgi:hypothetical protein
MPGRPDGISEKYISPNARMAMFLREHPNAKEPKYSTRTPSQVGIPSEFMGSAASDIVCFVELDPGDDGEVITAWHEIPAEEVYYEGRGSNRNKRTRPFSRTPEAWQKLCTMTLGRALKKAGYPDDRDDLALAFHFRQRIAELELYRQGFDVKALTAARIERGELMPPMPKEDEATLLNRAARPSEHEPDLDDLAEAPVRDLDAEHGGNVIDVDEHEEVEPDAEPDKVEWHPEVLSVVER